MIEHSDQLVEIPRRCAHSQPGVVHAGPLHRWGESQTHDLLAGDKGLDANGGTLHHHLICGQQDRAQNLPVGPAHMQARMNWEPGKIVPFVGMVADCKAHVIAGKCPAGQPLLHQPCEAGARPTWGRSVGGLLVTGP